MQLDDALKLINRLIKTGEKHADYQHTVDLAETYKIYITGKGIENKLRRFVPREDAPLFKQRTEITRATTPAVASSLRQPFNKVVRNDRVKIDINLENKSRRAIVDKMISMFYGSARKKNKGLSYWLNTRFLEMQFIDPNSWAVVEWDAAENPAQVIAPRPFEVSAEEAHNFFISNGETKWLLVCQGINFLSSTPGGTGGTGTSNAMVPLNPAAATIEPTKKKGFRYTLYDEDFTIVFEQIDKEYLAASGYVLGEKESYETIKEIDYLVKTFEPKVGYVPAFRIGYKRDEETKGRTFVNPWHDALCYFDKSLKTVSELDLTLILHTFPQKIQYVSKCKGRAIEGSSKTKGCLNGFEQGSPGTVCSACKGTGIKVITSAQDAIFLPMPDDPKDMVDLDKIMVYKAPPVELVKFQNDYVQQLERQTHQAVFNSQVFVKKQGGTGTGSGSSAPIQTATEADFNMQAVYDALEPFTEKYSDMWREFVIIFARIAGEEMDKIDVSHDFPADYKLKTDDILLSERKTAQDSGAPPFFIEAIDEDLAAVIYAGDVVGLNKYRVKRRYFPFSGKNESEVALLLASEYVPKPAKVLYANFDLIFRELETENVNFYVMQDRSAQRDMVTAKVEDFIKRLGAENPAPVLGNFRPITGGQGAGGTNDNGGQNNGNTGDTSNQGANQTAAA